MYEDPNLSNLFEQLNLISAQSITGDRTGGGKGGGSMPPVLDPMGTNPFVEMNLNPYLTQNVHSFKGGGKMHGPYKYAGGGSYEQQANQIIGMNQLKNIAMNGLLSNMSRNIANTPYIASPRIPTLANKGMKMKRKRYTQGGRF